VHCASCPSVLLPVCHILAHNAWTKGRRETKIGVDVNETHKQLRTRTGTFCHIVTLYSAFLSCLERCSRGRGRQTHRQTATRYGHSPGRSPSDERKRFCLTDKKFSLATHYIIASTSRLHGSSPQCGPPTSQYSCSARSTNPQPLSARRSTDSYTGTYRNVHCIGIPIVERFDSHTNSIRNFTGRQPRPDLQPLPDSSLFYIISSHQFYHHHSHHPPLIRSSIPF